MFRDGTYSRYLLGLTLAESEPPDEFWRRDEGKAC